MRYQPSVSVNDVKVGDMLEPRPLWNETEGTWGRRLPAQCEVLGVRRASNCQSGVLVSVKNNNREVGEYALAWFKFKDWREEHG